MQNLNDLEKMRQGQIPQIQQPTITMQQLHTGMLQAQQHSKQQPQVLQQNSQQVQPQRSQVVPHGLRQGVTKYDKFVIISIVSMFILLILIMCTLVIVDDVTTRRQIQANVEKALNSPKIQQQRARQAQRQREMAKQRRLKELGVDGATKPYQKNDLLNEKLREREIAQNQELLEQPQGPNYRDELAAYNARLQEIKKQESEAKVNM